MAKSMDGHLNGARNGFAAGALVQAHIAVFFMGMAGVLAGFSSFTPWQSTFYRVFLGGVMLACMWPFLGRQGRLPLKTILLALFLGALLGFHWFAFFKSIDLLGVTLGSAMIGTEPLVIALFAFVFLKERLSHKIMIAMAISSVGFLFLLATASSEGGHVFRGAMWSLGSFVIFAVLVIANRRLVGSHSPMLITALEMLGAIPVSWLFCRVPLIPNGLHEWLLALGLGVFCTGLAYLLFNTSMKKLPAYYAGALLSLEVAYGIVAGWILGDKLSAIQLLAALLIANILVFDIAALLSGSLSKKRRGRESTSGI